MAHARRGDPLFRVCISTQTTRYRNQSTCTCSPKKRYDKSTETVNASGNETINHKPTIVLKKTCTRCYSRKETAANEAPELPEPHAGSTIRFSEIREPESRDSPAPSPSHSPPDLTPKEIMNTWIPGIDRKAERLLPPSENYVDISPRDFSLRKYCPELFMSESEKKEMRTKEQEGVLDTRRQHDECRDPKCPQGSCGSQTARDFKGDLDWRTIVPGPETRTPCPWGDESIALAREREEVTDEELHVQTQTPSKPESKWFRWSCSKSKREKKPGNRSEDN